MEPADQPGAAEDPLPAFDPRWRVEKFLLRGRLERMPRRQEDRALVRRWLAASVTEVLEPVDERTLTERLAALVHDPVGARRDLVDAGLVTRTRDGAEYWRTHVTEFDAGSAGEDGPAAD